MALGVQGVRQDSGSNDGGTLKEGLGRWAGGRWLLPDGTCQTTGCPLALMFRQEDQGADIIV